MDLGVYWLGQMFLVYPLTGDWPDVPGVYIYARVNEDSWEPLYIGQTISLKNRLTGHEMLEEAQRLGAIYVHIRVVHLPVERDFIERQLIRVFQPPLNDHQG